MAMAKLRDDVKKTIEINGREITLFSLKQLQNLGYTGLETLPYSARILLESVLRNLDGRAVTEEHVTNILSWKTDPGRELPFMPARVLMQDFTGVPGIVDLAAMRDSLADMGGDAGRINPLIPVDLVIDHSVQVDHFGSHEALALNSEREFQRNRERYEFLHWAANSFSNFSAVPPATGIVHQVNLEYLAKVVQTKKTADATVVFPDTLVGTDSHTTMINALGVLGWGVGGIEAEAALLGQPLYIRMPELIGVRFSGALQNTVTATDLVLHVTQILRKLGVVGKIVEYFGSGLDALSLPDRATIANMCPEYGATAAFFPVDDITMGYLKTTGRDENTVALVETYCKEQGLYRSASAADPEYTQVVDIDLREIVPSIAGPSRPQDRISLSDAKSGFSSFLQDQKEPATAPLLIGGEEHLLEDGAVVLAAITSCTNTSNPSVLIAAGLLAKNAVAAGLSVPKHVKTSLAPGSRVVTRYLDAANLSGYLDQLGFHTVGYGCTTCIGNSGPLLGEVSAAIKENNLLVASVVSGNRNFEGRIHPEVRANYLASPPLVVAYALAGTMNIDLTKDPLGKSAAGKDIYLEDLWPSAEEIRQVVENQVHPALFREEYANVYSGNEGWNNVKSEKGNMYQWDSESTYIKRPPFFEGLTLDVKEVKPVRNARVLVFVGDSVTTDHISPAGVISSDSPAALWLQERGVSQTDYNSYGSRRGNHEVMMRGTLANIRIRNKLVPGVEGGYTAHLPDGKQLSVYDAAQEYAAEDVELIILAGKDYGMGSSRDWAAKGPALLGVRAVIAESFERIHRSNLIGMGILPLSLTDGSTFESLGLSGFEVYDIEEVYKIGQKVTVTARGETTLEFTAIARIDTEVEMDYYRNGGILHTVLRQMAGE